MRCAIIEMRLENTNRKFLTGWLAKANRKEENMKHPVKKIISHLLMFALVLAAGIDANADAETIDNVIALFCTENLSAEE